MAKPAPNSAAHVEGERVELHREPGVSHDRSGRTLAYLRYDGPGYADDIGHDMVADGLAVPYPAYAGSTRYMASLALATTTAAVTGQGRYGSTCDQSSDSTQDDTDRRPRTEPRPARPSVHQAPPRPGLPRSPTATQLQKRGTTRTAPPSAPPAKLHSASANLDTEQPLTATTTASPVTTIRLRGNR